MFHVSGWRTSSRAGEQMGRWESVCGFIFKKCIHIDFSLEQLKVHRKMEGGVQRVRMPPTPARAALFPTVACRLRLTRPR